MRPTDNMSGRNRDLIKANSCEEIDPPQLAHIAPLFTFVSQPACPHTIITLTPPRSPQSTSNSAANSGTSLLPVSIPVMVMVVLVSAYKITRSAHRYLPTKCISSGLAFLPPSINSVDFAQVSQESANRVRLYHRSGSTSTFVQALMCRNLPLEEAARKCSRKVNSRSVQSLK